MRRFSVLITTSLVATSTMTLAKQPMIIGVGNASCIQSDVEGLAAGLALTLLFEAKTKRGVATLGDPIESCLGDRNGSSGYRLQNATATQDLALATAGDVPKNWHVRSCTSHEGAHLLLYDGKRKAPIADTYYYAGYDIEPSCSEAELKAMASLGSR